MLKQAAFFFGLRHWVVVKIGDAYVLKFTVTDMAGFTPAQRTEL